MHDRRGMTERRCFLPKGASEEPHCVSTWSLGARLPCAPYANRDVNLCFSHSARCPRTKLISLRLRLPLVSASSEYPTRDHQPRSDRGFPQLTCRWIENPSNFCRHPEIRLSRPGVRLSFCSSAHYPVGQRDRMRWHLHQQ